MTNQEAKRLLALLKAAFPRQEISQETAEVYCRFLADVEYEQVAAAVQRIVATATYFPAIAEIRKLVAESKVGAPGWEEGWGEVLQAVSRFGRYKNPEFSHPAITAAVDSMGWLAICNSDESDLHILRAQFRDIYGAVKQRALTEANVKPLLEAAQRRREALPAARVLPLKDEK